MRRVNPSLIGIDQDNYFFHLARYMFVLRQLKGTESVLEVGCGTGYGTRLLADKAKSVHGVDKDPSLNMTWSSLSKDNLAFSDSWPDCKFDVVVCLEVIEHLDRNEAVEFLHSLKSKLNDNGIIFLSTPRALPFSERSHNRQLEHKHEYSPKEFQKLLADEFTHYFVFAQNDGLISTHNLECCWNMIAICIP